MIHLSHTLKSMYNNKHQTIQWKKKKKKEVLSSTQIFLLICPVMALHDQKDYKYSKCPQDSNVKNHFSAYYLRNNSYSFAQITQIRGKINYFYIRIFEKMCILNFTESLDL